MTLLAFLFGLSMGCAFAGLAIAAHRAVIRALSSDLADAHADLDESRQVAVVWHDAAMRWRGAAALERDRSERLSLWVDLLLLRARGGAPAARAMLRTLDEIAALPEREDER
jgi:pimeloyl-ACP methyl ester carboxylesterase